MTYSSMNVNIWQIVIIIRYMENKKIKERIKTLFTWRGITYEDYAKRMLKKNGKKISTSSLSHKLSRGTISFNEVIEIADELGYDIIFKPRSNWH